MSQEWFLFQNTSGVRKCVQQTSWPNIRDTIEGPKSPMITWNATPVPKSMPIMLQQDVQAGIKTFFLCWSASLSETIFHICRYGVVRWHRHAISSFSEMPVPETSSQTTPDWLPKLRSRTCLDNTRDPQAFDFVVYLMGTTVESSMCPQRWMSSLVFSLGRCRGRAGVNKNSPDFNSKFTSWPERMHGCKNKCQNVVISPWGKTFLFNLTKGDGGSETRITKNQCMVKMTFRLAPDSAS